MTDAIDRAPLMALAQRLATAALGESERIAPTVVFGHHGAAQAYQAALPETSGGALALMMPDILKTKGATWYAVFFEAWMTPLQAPDTDTGTPANHPEAEDALFVHLETLEGWTSHTLATITGTHPQREIGPWKTIDRALSSTFGGWLRRRDAPLQ